MKIPFSDLLGLVLTACVLLAGSALRCAGYLSSVI